MRQYRTTLALPGVRPLLLLIFFARIPLAAAGMVLTLHIAVGLGRGYGAAGTVGAIATVGIGLGAPVMGRIVDRYGLRPMLVLTAIGEATFWLTARHMSYPVLLGTAFLGGFLVLPAMSIGRQAIAALVPESLRRSAYSLDSISTELAYMTGPALAVLVTTQLTTTAALVWMATGIVVAGAALFLLNPPVRSRQELLSPGAATRPPRRTWLTPELVAALVIGFGAVFILASTELAVVAALRANGELGWTALVVAVWSVASVAGGLVYGAMRRQVRQITLMTWLALLTIPIGLLGGHWWLLMLAVVPAGALCAPTIAATGERVAALAPAAARGEASGLQSSASTFGAAAGAPLVGFAIDHGSAAWGFAVAGLGGALVAAVAAALIARQGHRRPEPQPTG